MTDKAQSAAQAPHSSVIYTDLTVRCHTCGQSCMWNYLEDDDVIQVLFHVCPSLGEIERRKFETSTAFVGYDFSRISDEKDQDFGDYVDDSTRGHWMGWLARAKEARPQWISAAAKEIDKSVLRFETREMEADPIGFLSEIIAKHATPKVESAARPQQLERLRDFISMVTEWTAKFPLKGEASEEDKSAALDIYCCCEGAEENLYELREISTGQAPSGDARQQPIIDILQGLIDSWKDTHISVGRYGDRVRSAEAFLAAGHGDSAEPKRGDPIVGRALDEERRPLVCSVCGKRFAITFNFCHEHKAEFEKLRADSGEKWIPAKQFAGIVLGDSMYAEWSGFDGSDIEEFAIKTGLLVQVRVTEPCAEGCACAHIADFPMDCNKLTDAGRAAINAAKELRALPDPPSSPKETK